MGAAYRARTHLLLDVLLLLVVHAIQTLADLVEEGGGLEVRHGVRACVREREEEGRGWCVWSGREGGGLAVKYNAP